jgi:hypothetical protein
MSSINRDGSLLELLRSARMELADIELDMDNHIDDDELEDKLMNVLSNVNVILSELTYISFSSGEDDGRED